MRHIDEINYSYIGHNSPYYHVTLITTTVAAPVKAVRDWNNGLCVLTTIGHLLVYSLPDLKLCFHRELFVNPSDQKSVPSRNTYPII